MNFEQVFATMRVGGRVRRKAWDHERFVRYDGEPLDEMGFQWMPRPADVMAVDWEVL